MCPLPSAAAGCSALIILLSTSFRSYNMDVLNSEKKTATYITLMRQKLQCVLAKHMILNIDRLCEPK